ncbi:NADH dehydrogenase (ubiquinone) 1 beta subcomplex 8 [Pseudohyphozyma bogoriensis]|nr:NADH dehydrogenase (ubiquinone) 1 beta subcomplex 8 [Pseudohyphozyma bogoriensis]
MLRTALTRRTLAPATVRSYASAAAAAPASNTANTALPQYDPEVEPALAGLNYPKLSEQSRQLRNPKGWWDVQERVNFDEPVPLNDDVQSMWAPDVHKVKPSSAVFQLALAFGFVGAFATAVYATFKPSPALPRAYPYDGLIQELSAGTDKSIATRPTSANEIEE